MTENAAVELQDVVKRFGAVTAVNHVSLKILDGEFFSLLGPSGCGKTTTLRLIAGFELPTSGQVYIHGDPQGYLPAYKRPVNTVFQHYALFPHMTVAQNVAFGMEMKKVDKEEIKQRVGEVLEMVHLSNMASRRPKQLSGGQQQRVALARALVNRPEVLLLDEPLGALDLKLRKAMQVELKTLQTQVGITFIYVTHDQEEALAMSDRIAVINQGKLLQVGTAQEIYELPSTRFVSDFIGETNYMEGQITAIEDGCASVIIGSDMHARASAEDNFRVGQQVSLAVRPEKMYINIDDQSDMNKIKGQVRNVVYMGSTTIFLIETQGGDEISLRQQNINAEIGTRLHPGDSVKVSWPIESSRLFSE